MPKDEDKVVSGLAQPARTDISSTPVKMSVVHFDADSVRTFPNRPYYERVIELAAWENKKKTEIVYTDKRLTTAVRTRLSNLGFSVGPVQSRHRTRTEFYFCVTW